MKRYLLILLLLLPACSDSDAWMGPVMLGGGVEAAGDCMTGCTGSYALCWTGEYATDRSDACYTDGVGYKDGTLTGGTITDAQNHTSGGGYSLLIDAGNERLSWAISSADIWKSSEGYISFWVYPTGSTGTNDFFEARVDSSNVYMIRMRDTEIVRSTHIGNAQNEEVSTSATLTLDQWNQVEVRWKVAETDIHSIKLNSGSWVETSDPTTLTAFTSEPTTILIGELNGTFSDTWYIDDLVIQLTAP